MLHKICRLCLCKFENSEYSKGANNSKTFKEICKILYETFHIKLSLTTRPCQELKDVCKGCQDKLVASHDFYQTVQVSQKLIKSGSYQVDGNDAILSAADAVIKIEPNLADEQDSYLRVRKDYLSSDDQETGGFDDVESMEVKPIEMSKSVVNWKVPQKKKSQNAKRKSSQSNIPTTPASKEQIDEEDRQIREFYSLKCTLCSESFKRFIEYKNHMLKKHNITKPTINCCDKNLTRRFRLLEHLIFHTNPEKYKCSDCGKQCIDPLSLERHRRQFHIPMEERRHQCEKCTKRFASTSSLRAHSLTHLSKSERNCLKTYVCDECGRGFMSKSKIDYHKRQRHMKLYACVCDMCAKTFQTKATFLSHYKKEHGTGQPVKAQCSVCLIWLSDEYSLKKHNKRIHSGNGPHICTTCGKVSPNEHALKSHQKWVHQTDRKFQCTYCNKAFKLEVALKEHTTTHLGGVLYTCCFCDRTFNSNANMYSHRKKMHPAEVEKLHQEKSIGKPSS